MWQAIHSGGINLLNDQFYPTQMGRNYTVIFILNNNNITMYVTVQICGFQEMTKLYSIRTLKTN